MDGEWVVLKTQPRREWSAARAIAAKGIPVCVPTLAAAGPSAGGPPRLLFPGYVLARPNRASHEVVRVRSAPGVAYVLPHGGPPAWLPDDVVRVLASRGPAAARAGFVHGDRVVVLAEPFRSVEAVFERRLGATGRVQVLLELVDRVVRLELNEQQLRSA